MRTTLPFTRSIHLSPPRRAARGPASRLPVAVPIVAYYTLLAVVAATPAFLH